MIRLWLHNLVASLIIAHVFGSTGYRIAIEYNTPNWKNVINRILNKKILALGLIILLLSAPLPSVSAEASSEKGTTFLSISPKTYTLNSRAHVTYTLKLISYSFESDIPKEIPLAEKNIECHFVITQLPFEDYRDYWGEPWGPEEIIVQRITDSNGEVSIVYTAPTVSSQQLQMMFGIHAPETLKIMVWAIFHGDEKYEACDSEGYTYAYIKPETIIVGDMGTYKDAGDNMDNAALIDFGSGTGKLDDFDRLDIYKINVAANQIFRVVMSPPPDANFDIDYQDPRTNRRYSSWDPNVGKTETFIVTDSTAGDVYITVSWKSGSGSYSLSIILGDDQNDMGYGRDAGENPDTATLISFVKTGTGHLELGDEVDLYKVYVPDSGLATIVVMIPPPDADFDLWIWEPGYPADQASLDKYTCASLKRLTGVAGLENVSALATASGYCYILVMRHSGSGDYSMEVSTGLGVEVVSGSLEGKTQGSTVWVSTSGKTILKVGDVLRSVGSVAVQLAIEYGATTILLGPASSLQLVNVGPGSIAFGLLEGFMETILKNVGKALWEFIAGTFKAIVHGTDFTMEASEDDKITIQVFEGTVEVQDLRSNSSALLEANKSIIITKTQVGLTAQELKQKIEAFDPKSAKKLWDGTSSSSSGSFGIALDYVYPLLAVIILLPLIIVILRRKKAE